MSIQKLSNLELDQSLKRAVASERKILHLVLEHILEVENRQMFLEKSYPSLYEYLVQECGYTGSAAMRRMGAARLMKEIPIVADKIQSGDLNLSQIGDLSRAIKEKQKSGIKVDLDKKIELIEAISGKTVESSQKEISMGLDLELKPLERSFVQKDESVFMQISLSKEQHQLYQICRDLEASTLLNEYKDTSFLAVFEFLAKSHLKHIKMDEVIADLEVTRSERSLLAQEHGHGKDNRLASNNNSNLQQNSNSAEKPLTSSNQTYQKQISVKSNEENIKPAAVKEVAPLKINKTLTPKTRRMVLLKHKSCQFQDPKTGKICGSTFNLAVDHKVPLWAKGGHEMENLQALCPGHNNYKYRKESNLRLF